MGRLVLSVGKQIYLEASKTSPQVYVVKVSYYLCYQLNRGRKVKGTRV